MLHGRCLDAGGGNAPPAGLAYEASVKSSSTRNYFFKPFPGLSPES